MSGFKFVVSRLSGSVGCFLVEGSSRFEAGVGGIFSIHSADLGPNQGKSSHSQVKVIT